MRFYTGTRRGRGYYGVSFGWLGLLFWGSAYVLGVMLVVAIALPVLAAMGLFILGDALWECFKERRGRTV